MAKESCPLAAISEDVSADLSEIEVPILVTGGKKEKVDSADMLQVVVMY